MNKINICFVVTIEFAAVNYLKNHIIFLNNTGKFNVTLILNTSNRNKLEVEFQNIQIIHVNIKRKLNLFLDILILLKLYKIFKRSNYDIVHSIMPKAGLLAMMAARFSQIPLRFHTFTGQVWVDSNFVKKSLLKKVDNLIANSTTFNLTDSKSQMEFLIKNNIVASNKIAIIGNGSICGFDESIFIRNEFDRFCYRTHYKYKQGDIVFIFLGRMSKAKGIFSLLEVFLKLSAKYNNIKLLLVGPEEAGSKSLIIDFVNKNDINNLVILIDNTFEPHKYLNVSDVLCLPSEREGFGSVVIEAGAMKIPTIGSRIYGLTDSIVDGHTGLLFEKNNNFDFYNKMELLINSPNLRIKLGLNAYKFVNSHFKSSFVSSELESFYIKNVIIEK